MPRRRKLTVADPYRAPSARDQLRLAVDGIADTPLSASPPRAGRRTFAVAGSGAGWTRRWRDPRASWARIGRRERRATTAALALAAEHCTALHPIACPLDLQPTEGLTMAARWLTGVPVDVGGHSTTRPVEYDDKKAGDDDGV